MSRYRLLQPLAPEGTILDAPGPNIQRSYGRTAEVVVELDRNHTVNIVVDLQTIEECPQWFEEIPENPEPEPKAEEAPETPPADESN